MKARDSKLEEFTKTKPKSETVVIGDILQKIANRDLELTIKFRLTPIGYGLCSHLKAIIYFDEQRLRTFYTSVPETMKNLRKELTVEVFTKFGQVNAGIHKMKIDISGQLPSGQTLGLVSSKEFTVNIPYLEEPKHPTTRQIVIDRIESGSSISIITPDIQKLYKEMEEHRKRELRALREGW